MDWSSVLPVVAKQGASYLVLFLAGAAIVWTLRKSYDSRVKDLKENNATLLDVVRDQQELDRKRADTMEQSILPALETIRGMLRGLPGAKGEGDGGT